MPDLIRVDESGEPLEDGLARVVVDRPVEGGSTHLDDASRRKLERARRFEQGYRAGARESGQEGWESLFQGKSRPAASYMGAQGRAVLQLFGLPGRQEPMAD